VLLEEHPLQRFGAIDAMFRSQRRPAHEVPQDRVRFGEVAPGCGFEQRDLAVRIFGEELGRATLAFEDIHFNQAVGNAELGERKAHLVAVARSLHGIERMHRLP